MKIAVKKDDLIQKCKAIICEVNRVREIKTKKLHRDYVLKHYKDNGFFRKKSFICEQPTEKQLDDMEWLKDTARKIIDRDGKHYMGSALFSFYCEFPTIFALAQELLNAAELHMGGDLLEINSKEAVIFEYNCNFKK